MLETLAAETLSRRRLGGPGRVGWKGKKAAAAGRGVWARSWVAGKLVERDGLGGARLGGEGLGGSAGGNGLSHFLSLLRGEQRPLKAGVMEAEKNTARPGTGAIVQIRRREGEGSREGEENAGEG